MFSQTHYSSLLISSETLPPNHPSHHRAPRGILTSNLPRHQFAFTSPVEGQFATCANRRQLDLYFTVKLNEDDTAPIQVCSLSRDFPTHHSQQNQSSTALLGNSIFLLERKASIANQAHRIEIYSLYFSAR